MTRLLILSALFVATGVTFNTGKITTPTKPGTAVNTTVAAIKLAEAKAVLSKGNFKSSKGTLGTADGGI